MTDVTDTLRAMLGDSEDRAAEREPGETTVESFLAATAPAIAPNLALLQQTGRGPTGRLRNFRAMNPRKFRDVYTTVHSEDNDTEAMEALEVERVARELPHGFWINSA